MSGSWRTRIAGSLAAMSVIAGLAAAPAAPATISTNHTGTTSDGGSWSADVPSPWNGAVLLYSHGFGPLVAADAPDPATKQALLDRGYALVGSSYDPAGSWWALGSALRDQFEALDAIRALLPSKPREVIAFGTSTIQPASCSPFAMTSRRLRYLRTISSTQSCGPSSATIEATWIGVKVP